MLLQVSDFLDFDDGDAPEMRKLLKTVLERMSGFLKQSCRTYTVLDTYLKSSVPDPRSLEQELIDTTTELRAAEKFFYEIRKKLIDSKQ